MHAQACRAAPGAGVCCAALEPACLLVSYTASPEREAQKRKAGLDDQAKGTKVVHWDGTNQITIDQSLTYC